MNQYALKQSLVHVSRGSKCLGTKMLRINLFKYSRFLHAICTQTGSIRRLFKEPATVSEFTDGTTEALAKEWKTIQEFSLD